MQQVSFTFLAIVLLAACLEIAPTSGQITFSKDWRAGGKRSSPSSSASLSASSLTTLATKGISVLELSCDKIEKNFNTKIRDLVRKEAIALLQCEIFANKNKGRMESSEDDKGLSNK